ncbi:MAG: M20 family metallopeptidase [Gemmatimonadota bacterium]
MSTERARRLVDWVHEHREELVEYVRQLALVESPSTDHAAQAGVQRLLRDGLESAGLRVRHLRGRGLAGHLFARTRDGSGGRPFQLLLGHTDTVWPLGTVDEMPVEVTGEVIRGPGVYDMKGGLAQIVFALRALRDLRLTPPAEPAVLINSDEETGSVDSTRYVRMLAQRAARVFVLEPAAGPTGKLKTARKGGGRFEIEVFGRNAHAGLDPQAGASAILELSHVIQELHALNDPARGITVNVGVIEGGSQPNVVAARAHATVDVRVPSAKDAARVEYAISAIRPITPGTRLHVTGRIGRPPMTRTAGNRALWEAVRAAGLELGLDLEETAVGGMSDGNTTSRYAATIDGMGPIGDGAHAAHEFVAVEGLLERTALLANVLLLPL